MHLSYSSVTTLASCGERFRLQKLGVPQRPAWALIGGRAFHTATERYDRMLFSTGECDIPPRIFEDAFDEEIADQERRNQVPRDEWQRSGRATKENPDKEDEKWWRANGQQMVKDYVADILGSSWQLWKLPQGELAIEVNLRVTVGGAMSYQAIDRILVDDQGNLIIRDLKTSKREPFTDLQLGVYALGVQQAFGERPMLGDYYMARMGKTSAVRSLARYTQEYVDDMFSTARRAWEEGIFLANPGDHCRICGVAPFCAAIGGEDADQYRGRKPEAK